MSCPTELVLASHADDALDAASAAEVDAHVAACHRCQARLGQLRAEIDCIAAALALDDEHLAVPPFRRPVAQGTTTLGGGFALGIAALAAAGPALLGVALQSRFAGLEPVLSWLNPFDAGGLARAGVRAILFLSQSGGDLMNSITETAVAVVVISLVTWIAVALGRRTSVPLALGAILGAVILAPGPAEALEIRTSEEGAVYVAADETIDDTLVAAGNTVEIDGIVRGDLIAVGRAVVVRGRVDGAIITAAQSVNIEGEAEGSVIGAAQTLNLTGAQIGRNLFGFGTTINASSTSRIGSNAVVFAGQSTILSGPVGRDVYSFSNQHEIGNTVGGDLTVFGSSVSLLGPARVTGDLTAHVPTEADVSVSPSATIGGELRTETRERPEPENQYATGGYYVGQLLRYAAAFVTGLLVLALVPGLRSAGFTSVGNGFVVAAVGLITLAAVPVIAIIAAVFVIGIPVAILGLMLYVVGLYLAKIMVAHFVGRRILERGGTQRHFATALAIGLALVIVAVDLPFLGGLLNFVLTLAGLGLIVMFGWEQVRGTTVPEAAIG
jgi:cytoskeletal protein CcmA (bactofilin family)